MLQYYNENSSSCSSSCSNAGSGSEICSSVCVVVGTLALRLNDNKNNDTNKDPSNNRIRNLVEALSHVLKKQFTNKHVAEHVCCAIGNIFVDSTSTCSDEYIMKMITSVVIPTLVQVLHEHHTHEEVMRPCLYAVRNMAATVDKAQSLRYKKAFLDCNALFLLNIVRMTYSASKELTALVDGTIKAVQS
jgi:hypothetical protein